MFTIEKSTSSYTESDIALTISLNLSNQINKTNYEQDLKNRVAVCYNKTIKKLKQRVIELVFRDIASEKPMNIKKEKLKDYPRGIFSIINYGLFNPDKEKETKEYFQPRYIVLEGKIPPKDIESFVEAILEECKKLKHVTILVLRNLSLQCIENLKDIHFPKNLTLRIEHTDLDILKASMQIRLKIKDTQKVSGNLSKKDSNVSQSNSVEDEIASNDSFDNKLSEKSDDSSSENRQNHTASEISSHSIEQKAGEKSSSEFDSESEQIYLIKSHFNDNASDKELSANQSNPTIISLEAQTLNTPIFDALDTIQTLLTDIRTPIADLMQTNKTFNKSKANYEAQINQLNSTLSLKEKQLKELKQNHNKELENKDQKIVLLIQQKTRLEQEKINLEQALSNKVNPISPTNKDTSLLQKYILEVSTTRKENKVLTDKNQQLQIELETIKLSYNQIMDSLKNHSANNNPEISETTSSQNNINIYETESRKRSHKDAEFDESIEQPTKRARVGTNTILPNNNSLQQENVSPSPTIFSQSASANVTENGTSVFTGKQDIEKTSPGRRPSLSTNAVLRRYSFLTNENNGHSTTNLAHINHIPSATKK